MAHVLKIRGAESFTERICRDAGSDGNSIRMITRYGKDFFISAELEHQIIADDEIDPQVQFSAKDDQEDDENDGYRNRHPAMCFQP